LGEIFIYNITQYYDEGDILIYGDNWVSWLSPDSYNARQELYEHWNFGGTAEWAIDLSRTYDYNGTGSLELFDDDTLDSYPCANMTFSSLADLLAAQGIPDSCLPLYSLQTLINMLDATYDNYTNNVNNGYDSVYSYYITAMDNTITNSLDNLMWNMNSPRTTGVLPYDVGNGMNCKFPSPLLSSP
jgi:hypothetical protein